MYYRANSKVHCGVVLILVLCCGSAIAQQSPDRSGPEDLAQKVVEIWSSHDVEMVDDVFVDDGVYEDVAMQLMAHGKAEIKELMLGTFAGFPDFVVELKRAFSSNNTIACEWIMSGTHTGDFPGYEATGRPFSVRGASVAVVRDGKVVRWTDYYDRYDLMRQLGALDDPGSESESANK